MRKVKLLALLLAVLMVVTAFAGCANTDVIESDVANLDERVTALENLLNGIDKEIDDVTAKIESVDQQIADLKGTVEADKTAEEIAALEKQLADQKAELEAQKAAAEAAKAAADAAKAAADAAAKAAEKAAADQKAANDALAAQIAEMLKQQQADKEAAEQAAAAAKKALDDAKTAANAQIAAIEAANPGKYADLIAAAKATVAAATTVEAAQKAVDTLNAGIAAQSAADAAAATAAALAAAQKVASEEIAVIREQKKDDKVLYLAADYEAIVKALAAADTNVAAAKDKATVDAIVADLKAELADYVAIDEALYNYIDGLWRNLTEANRPLYDEMQDYIYDVEKELDTNDLAVYFDGKGRLNDFVKYEYDEETNGDKKVMQIFEMITAMESLYSLVPGNVAIPATSNSPLGTSVTYVTYSEITADVAAYNVLKAVDEAKKLDARINDFLTNKNFKESYAFLRAEGSSSMFGDLVSSYDDFIKNTKIFPDSVRAIVTKLSEVERLKGVVDNYVAAEKALLELGSVDYTNQTVLNVFQEHKYAAVAGVYAGHDTNNNPFYNATDKTFTTNAVFAPIDKEIADWASKFKLNTADYEAILAAKIPSVSYAEYKIDRTYVKLMDDKFAAFKKDIVPLIDALAGQKYVNKSAFEAYKNLDSKLDAWASAKVSNKYNYVNTTNLALMFALLGEDFAGITLYADVNTGNIGYQSSTDIAAIDWLNTTLVNFKYTDVKDFFLNEFTNYKNQANAINTRITALTTSLNNRQLTSIIPILEVEDKTIQLTSASDPDDQTYISLADAAVLLTVKNHDGSLAWTYGASTAGTAGTYQYLSDLSTSQAPATTIREFEEDCAANGYVDLAEYLIDYSKYNDLKAKYEKRTKELLDNGATQFIADVKAIKYVALKADETKISDRDYDTVYASSKSLDVNYVTLNDETTYNKAKATLSTWVSDFGGRTEYKEVIAKEIKFTVTNQAGSDRELAYDGGFVEREILQGYDVIYGNVHVQMGVLQDAKEDLVKAMTNLKKAMAAGSGCFDLDNLSAKVVIDYVVASNGKVTWKELSTLTGDFVAKNAASESAVSITTTYTVEQMINDAYLAYCRFEMLNKNWKSDGKADTDEKYLETVKIDGQSIKSLIDELKLFYAKAQLIKTLETLVAQGTAEAGLADLAKENVAKCTKLQGVDASAVSNWHEYLLAHFSTGLVIPTITTETKAKAGDAVTSSAVALYTIKTVA